MHAVFEVLSNYLRIYFVSDIILLLHYMSVKRIKVSEKRLRELKLPMPGATSLTTNCADCLHESKLIILSVTLKR